MKPSKVQRHQMLNERWVRGCTMDVPGLALLSRNTCSLSNGGLDNSVTPETTHELTGQEIGNGNIPESAYYQRAGISNYSRGIVPEKKRVPLKLTLVQYRGSLVSTRSL